MARSSTWQFTVTKEVFHCKYPLQWFTLLSILMLLPNRIRLVKSGPHCIIPGGHCSHCGIAKWCTPKVILQCILGPSHPQMPQGQIVDCMHTFLQIIMVILYNQSTLRSSRWVIWIFTAFSFLWNPSLKIYICVCFSWNGSLYIRRPGWFSYPIVLCSCSHLHLRWWQIIVPGAQAERLRLKSILPLSHSPYQV